MKKLLLLLLFVGFNANGADELIISRTGLEGIAKDGLLIFVPASKGIDVKAIENQVELRLVQAGVKVNKKEIAHNILFLHAQPIENSSGVIGYALDVEAKRTIKFEANGKTYWSTGVAVWDTGGIVGKDDLKEVINIYMDAFLLDYLKANPKKKD